MKKILVLALTLILSVTLIGVLNLKETGFIADEGYITTTDNDVLNLVLRNDVDLNNIFERKESLSKIEAMSKIYKTINGVYVTDDKLQLNETFPMYLNDGNVVRFFNEDSVLIENNFDSITTYNGLYLSRGSSFNSGGGLADLAEFIVTLLPSGLFMNAQDMSILVGTEKTKIKMNSILYLDKERINYLEFSCGELIYSTLKVKDDSLVKIGNNSYNYGDLYKRLFDIREELNIPDPIIPTHKPSDKLEIFDDDRQEHDTDGHKQLPDKDIVDLDDTLIPEKEVGSREDSGEIHSGEESATGGNAGITESVPAAEPFVLFDKDSIIPSVYQAKASIVINDKNGLIRGGVGFYVYNDEDMKSLQLRKTIKETGDITLEILEPDRDYYLMVKYEFKNHNGDKVTVVKTPTPVKFRTLKREGHLEPIDFTYALEELAESPDGKPLFFHDKIKVRDLKFNYTEDAFVSERTTFTSGTYSEFNNELNLRNKVDVRKFDPNNVPMEVVVNYISAIEVSISPKGTTDNAVKFLLTSEMIDKLRAGETIEYTSPSEKLLSSNEYQYQFKLYDKFNYELKNKAGEAPIGYTHTCKVPPKMNVYPKSYRVKNVVLDLELINDSGINLDDLYLVISPVSDLENPISLTGKITSDLASRDITMLEGNKLSLMDLFGATRSRATLQLTNLAFGANYNLKIYGTYMLDNGLNIASEELLYAKDFTTLRVEDAGKAYYDYNIYDITSNSVKYAIKYKQETSEDITNIIDEINFDLERLDKQSSAYVNDFPSFEFAKEKYHEVEIDKDLSHADPITNYMMMPLVTDFDNLDLQIGTVNVNLYYDKNIVNYADNVWDLFKLSRNENVYLEFVFGDNLYSKNDYKISVDSLVKLNVDDEGISVSEEPKLRENEFKTLKKAAEVNLDINSIFKTSNYVEFSMTEPLVYDPDGAVISGVDEQGETIPGIMITLHSKSLAGTTQLVYTDYVNTNELIPIYKIDNLDPTVNSYLLTVTALFYNEGYDDTKTAAKVWEIGEFDVKNTINASIDLYSVEKQFESKTLDEKNLLYGLPIIPNQENVGHEQEIGLHEGYYGTSNGQLDNYKETNYFIVEVKPDTYYALVDGSDGASGAGYIYQYKSDKASGSGSYKGKYLITSSYNRTHSNVTFKTRSNVDRLVINVSTRGISTAKLIELPSSYEDYSLVEPNSDITNQIKIDIENQSINYRFEFKERDGYFISDYIEVDDDSFYRIKTTNNTDNSHYITMYDKDYEAVGIREVSERTVDDLPTLFYLPSEVKYIRIDMPTDCLTPEAIANHELFLQKYMKPDEESIARLDINMSAFTGDGFFDTYDQKLTLKETFSRNGDEVYTRNIESDDLIINQVDGKPTAKSIKIDVPVNIGYDYEYQLMIGLKDKVSGEIIREVELDSVSFDSSKVITSINSQYDISKLLVSPKGEFVINQDILIDRQGLDVMKPLHIDDYWQYVLFNGHLDGNGHTIIKETPDYLLRTIGEDGIIENINYIMRGKISNGRSAFIEYNQGIVRNIRLELDVDYSDATGISSNYGMITYNFANGIVENFYVVVKNFETYRLGATVVGENRGLIRNGYVTGEPVKANAYKQLEDGSIVNTRINNDSKYSEYVGVLVQNNIPSGTIESCYTTNDLVIDECLTRKDYDNTMSTLVARGNGTVRNCYTLGNIIIRGVRKINGVDTFYLKYGGDQYQPMIKGGIYDNLSYFTKDPYPYGDDGSGESSIEKPYYKLKDINLVRSYTVYDFNWHESILSNEFEIKNNVARGVLPTIKQGEKMSRYANEFVTIDSIVKTATGSADIKFKSSSVVTEGVDTDGKEYAVIKVAFENKLSANIVGLKFTNLKEVREEDIISQETVFDNYFVTFKVKIDETRPLYRSQYKLEYIKAAFRGETGLRTISFNNVNNYIYPSFYQPIETVDDYFSISDISYYKDHNEDGRYLAPDIVGDKVVGNYRLVADLDFKDVNFKNLPYAKVLGGSYNFGGKLDGTKFEKQEDGTYIKTGFYEIKNARLGKGSNANFIREIYNGSVSNIIFNNIDNTESSHDIWYTGIIRYAEDAKFDNVHVINSNINGARFVGAIVGQTTRCEIINTSVTDSKVTGIYDERAQDSRIGGLVGYSSISEFRNSYSANTEVIADSPNTVLGTGGLVGYMDSSRIYDCYTNNYVSSTSVNTGGVVGYMDYSAVERCYSASNVYSGAHVIGGVIGYSSTNCYIYNNLSAGSVSAKLDSCVDINVMTGSSVVDFMRKEHYYTQGNFAFDGFAINDVSLSSPKFVDGRDPISSLSYDTMVNTFGVNKILNEKSLSDPNTYLEVMNFGDAYDYVGELPIYGSNRRSSSVTSGYLPMLKSTTGEILYGQKKIKLRSETPALIRAEVHNQQQDGLVQRTDAIVMVIELPERLKEIDSRYFSDLYIEGVTLASDPSKVVFDNNHGTLSVEIYDATINSYYDKYLVRFDTEIGTNNVVTSSLFVNLGSLAYTIDSVDKWNNFFSVNPRGYNNIVLSPSSGVLDFSGASENVYNVRVNNVTYTSASDEPLQIIGGEFKVEETSLGLISEITGYISNVKFKDFHFTCNDNDQKKFIGVISKNHGVLKDVTFENIDIDLMNNTSKPGTKRTTMDYYIGAVGYATGDFINVSLSNVHIKGGAMQRAGLVVGEIRPHARFEGVKINSYTEGTEKNNTLEFSRDAYYIGGAIGIAYGPFDNLALDKCDIGHIEIKNARHTGGAIGYISTTGTFGDLKVHDIFITNDKKDYNDNIGGLIGTAYGTLKASCPIILDNINIRSEYGTSIGGALGYAGTEIRQVHISNSNIAGYMNVGGISNNHVYDSVARNINVVGLGNGASNIGGIVGTITNPHQQRNLIVDSYIGMPKSGESDFIKPLGGDKVENVGGIIGYTPFNQNGNINANTIINTNVKGTNNIGGVIGKGNGQVYENNLFKDTIEGQENIGGIIGYAVGSYLENNNIADTTKVIGDNKVGGVAGYINTTEYNGNGGYRKINLIKNVIGSEVVGRDNIGGIVGLVTGKISEDETKNNEPNISKNIFLGNIHSENPSSHISIGTNVQASLDSEVRKFHDLAYTRYHEFARENGLTVKDAYGPYINYLPAKLNTPIDKAKAYMVKASDLALEKTYNDMGMDYHDRSFDNLIYFEEDNSFTLDSTASPNVMLNDSAQQIKVTEDKVYTLTSPKPVKWYRYDKKEFVTDTKKSQLISNGLTNTIDVAGAGYYYGVNGSDKYGFFLIDIDPYLPYLNKSTWNYEIMPGAEGYDEVLRELYPVDDVNKYQGGVINYRKAPASGKSMYLATNSFIKNVEVPEVVAYATAVDTLNLELNNVSSLISDVTIVTKTKEYKVDFDSRVISLKYDFSEDFTLKYKFNNYLYETSFNACDLVRTVDTYHDNYYYLNSNRVGNKNGEFGSDMIHIFNNLVMDKNGHVYDIDTKENIRSLSEEDLFTKTNLTPLYEGEFEKMKLKTFRNFMLSDDEVIECPVVIINNEMYSLITSDVSRNGFILDNDIMYFLESNGELTQYGTEIKVPKGISLSGIREVNDNYDSNNKIILIRYENNALVGFNYMTGDMIEFNNIDAPVVSLKEFAKGSNKKQEKSDLATKYSNAAIIQGQVIDNQDASKKVDAVIEELKLANEAKAVDFRGPEVDGLAHYSGLGENTSSSGSSGSSENSSVHQNNPNSVCKKDDPTSIKQEANEKKDKEALSKDKYLPVYNKETHEFEVHDKYELLSGNKELVSVDKILDNLEKGEFIAPKPKLASRLIAVVEKNDSLGLPITMISIVLVLSGLTYLYFRRNK